MLQKSSVHWFAEQFINATIDRRHILPKELNSPDIGHFGYFRPKFKDTFWN